MIRKASIKDLDLVLNIINSSKAIMKENNINQWYNNYPSKETISLNINNCIIIDDVACFSLECEKQAYLDSFLIKSPYITIHRVSVKKEYSNKGYGSIIFKEAERIARSKNINKIVIDTSITNFIMQKLIDKNNYKYIGLTTVSDNTQRLVFIKTLDHQF